MFAEGEYRGSEAEPATIKEALENMDADGTASILDIDHVADKPEPTAVTVLNVVSPAIDGPTSPS